MGEWRTAILRENCFDLYKMFGVLRLKYCEYKLLKVLEFS